jgi:hypothetical protein
MCLTFNIHNATPPSSSLARSLIGSGAVAAVNNFEDLIPIEACWHLRAEINKRIIDASRLSLNFHFSGSI